MYYWPVRVSWTKYKDIKYKMNASRKCIQHLQTALSLYLLFAEAIYIEGNMHKQALS